MARVVGASGRLTVSVDDDGTVRLTETGKASGGYYMPPEYALELAALLERAAEGSR
jgi:hypothetical protein